MLQGFLFLYLLCISCPMDLQCPIKAVTINQSTNQLITHHSSLHQSALRKCDPGLLFLPALSRGGPGPDDAKAGGAIPGPSWGRHACRPRGPHVRHPHRPRGGPGVGGRPSRHAGGAAGEYALGPHCTRGPTGVEPR